MSTSSQTALAFLVLSSAVACGPAEPAAPAPIMPVATPSGPAVAAPPTRARWVFAHPERGLNAKMDLDGGQTLYVGQYGRRTRAALDGSLTDAPTLALDHLTGVMRDGADYVFVGDDGDVAVSQDPLAPLGPSRPGPLGATAEGKPAKFSSMATGHAAIVGITADGRVLRSGDFGRNWAPIDYAGSTKPFGHPYSVALDTKGNGLLIALPQRLYVTRDDGATWTPMPTPGIGASWVRTDGADRIFLSGASERAKLDGAQLTLTTDELAPLRTTPPTTGPATTISNGPTEMLLSGDRVVELTLHRGARPTVEVASRNIGDPPGGAGTSTSDLLSARSTSSPSDPALSAYVAGFQSSLIYARADDTKDADGAVTTTLLSSGDLGATWKTDATFKGHIIDHGSSDRGMSEVALGPGGFAFVRAMCPPGISTEANEKCTRRQVRPAGASAFEDLSAVEDFSPMKFAFDIAHAKVYVLGKHEGRVHVYESALGQNKFARLNMLDAAGPAAMAVDPSGVLRVLAYDWQVSQWKLLRHTNDGVDSPVLWGPTDMGELAMTGLRGLISGDHSAWETADGGESWSRVASNGSGAGDLACADAGCMMGGAERVGWDLPAYDSPEKIVAQTDPKKSATQPQTRPQMVSPAPIELLCKVAGAASPVPTIPATDAMDARFPDAHFFEVKDDQDHKISIVVGGKNAVRVIAMLGAEPTKPAPKPGASPETGVQYRTWVFPQREGVSAVRAVWTPQVGDPPPVDLEIAWWASATNKVARRTLPKFKAFAVQRWGAIGEAHIVDGGVIFRSAYGEPVHFLRDDGKKDETFTPPNGAVISNTVRIGDRWILPLLSSGTAKLTFSENGGDKWTTKSWRLDEYGTISIAQLGAKPYLAFNVSVGALPAFQTIGLVALDSITDDPPAPIVVPRGVSDVACDAQASTYRASANLTPGSRPLIAKVEAADKTSADARTTDRGAHPTAAGAYCASVYRLTGDTFIFAEETSLAKTRLSPETSLAKTRLSPETSLAKTRLSPETSRYSGVRFRRVPDPREPNKSAVLAEQLTCAPSAPKP